MLEDITTTLTITIKDRMVLYASYMPFLTTGGLFIPTARKYVFGAKLQLVIHLMDEKETFKILSSVVWITPKDAQTGKAAGIGVQFIQQGSEALKSKIETYLAAMLRSQKPTHTM